MAVASVGSEVIFWPWCQCWRAARSWLLLGKGHFFSPSQRRNVPMTSPKVPGFVWASVVSSMKVWKVWATGKCVCASVCSLSTCFHYLLVQDWEQIFLPKVGSFGKSEQGCWLCEGRRRGGQEESFRTEGGEEVACGWESCRELGCSYNEWV